MTSIRRWTPGLFICLALGLCTQARAELFTYNFVAGSGVYANLTGFFTISGNAGDPFALDPNFDGVTNFDLSWGGFPFFFDFNPSNSFDISPDTIGFIGTLGDPVLTPDNDDNTVFLLGPEFFSEAYEGLELDSGPADWIVGLFPIEPFDGGAPWDLELATTPLPTGMSMGLAGIALLAIGGGYRSWRRSKNAIA